MNRIKNFFNYFTNLLSVSIRIYDENIPLAISRVHFPSDLLFGIAWKWEYVVFNFSAFQLLRTPSSLRLFYDILICMKFGLVRVTDWLRQCRCLHLITTCFGIFISWFIIHSIPFSEWKLLVHGTHARTHTRCQLIYANFIHKDSFPSFDSLLFPFTSLENDFVLSVPCRWNDGKKTGENRHHVPRSKRWSVFLC